LRAWAERPSRFADTIMSSSEEIFDVVDAADTVIGRRSRREVHACGLRHRAAHVLVFNRRSELFLQKRAMSKDSSPGLWDSSAAGHVDSGEAYDTCARRELAEELGLEPAEPPQRLFKLEACADTGEEFVWVYRVCAEGPFALDALEIETGAWFTQTAVSAWVAQRPDELSPVFRMIWSRFYTPAG
jgi:isopentenyl-diphosphate delta-isomerase type 1